MASRGNWTRILAYISGSVDQELLLRNEYLAAENRILRTQLNGCLRLSDTERATLGEIGFRLGRKALSDVATVAQPDTILAWHRGLIARKFEGSRARRVRGRPRIDREVEGLIVRMAEENRSWGCDRIVGRSPIWDMRSLIRRSATCCVVTVYRGRRSAKAGPPGQNSFGSTSRCSRGWTFPRPRSLCEDW
jgi:hypothetical protein